ncbi:MAG: hypothetical protein H6Q86_4290, partial [candidate division NC10 bacterium]|nr:hypothetical protein [candidate division NC10 bacterium]
MSPGDSVREGRASFDPAAAALVSSALLLLYWWTLLPGLGGTEDTPKFQYIGAALGTPHEPGYPLYILLSYVFSKLPIGILAYRINLLSAVCGAATGGIMFLSLRRLGVHAWIAAAIALGLGVGRTFWQHSVFAEVYTPAAALTAATFLALLTWDATRRTAWLYAAVTFACLAFGVHMVILGVVPALVLFVLATFSWRPPRRVLAITGLIVVAGIAQYGYVWLRTIQRAEYLEAKARTAWEFVDVLRAKQFQGITFADSSWVMLTRRLPAVAGEVRDELGLVAVAAALVGCGALLWNRPRLGILLGAGAIGPVFLLATLGEVAIGPILLAGEVPAWLLAGVGMDALRTAFSTVAPRWLSVVVAGCLAAGVPVAHTARNYAFNNHRHDAYYTDYFRALFQWIPSRAGFIDEEYVLNNMVMYQRYSSGRRNVRVGVPANIAAVESLRSERFDLFAFDRGRAALEGLAVFRPVPPLVGQ